MKRGVAYGLAALLAATPSGATSVRAPAPVAPTIVRGGTYAFERVADGIWYATGGFGSNDVVIVGPDDIVLVDTASSPAATRRLVADIRRLSVKPIRYVVNTHWHYDHTDGNQVFGPEVTIIGHDATYTALRTLDVVRREPFRSSQPAFAADYADGLRREADRTADPAAAAIRKRASEADRMHRELVELRPTAPTLTFSDRLVLHRGGREIDLLFLGRGHTAGDAVVYLPAEKIVCTGDLLLPGKPYLGDAWPDEWIATLDRVRALGWTTVLPGHGAPFTDRRRIDALQSYIADITRQASALHAQGKSAEDAARLIDLRAHAADFPAISGPGAGLRDVRGIYAWLDRKAGRVAP